MDSITTCERQTVYELKNRLSHIYKVIETYRWIIEAYVSDFYVKDHWSSLPLSWQQFLEQLDFSSLSCLLSGQPWDHAVKICSVCPLSLLALKAFIEQYALNRHCVDLDHPAVAGFVSKTLLGNKDVRASPGTVLVDHSMSASSNTLTNKTLGFKNGQLMEMEHIFRKHVKPKKQHEIRQLGKVIYMVTQLSGSDHVVDVGAGLGHLSRFLTFAHGLKVTTVEAAGGHAPKASEFDKELKKDIQKKLKRKEPMDQLEKTPFMTPADLPNHVVCMVQPDISTKDFLALVVNRGCKADCSEEGMVNLPCDNNTPSKMGEDSMVSMECSNSPQTATALSCSGHNGSASFSNKTSSSILSVTDTFSNPAAPSVCKGEKSAKISKYDRDSDLKCDKIDALLDENKVENFHFSHRNISTSCNQYKRQQTHQSDSDKSAFVSESQDVVTLSKDKDLNEEKFLSCLKQTRTKIDPSENEHIEPSESRNRNREDVADMSENDLRQLSAYQKQSICDESSEADCKGKDKNVFPDQKRCGCGDDNMVEGGRGLVLAGLHACGDLTGTLLRVFVNCPAVSALVSVGCCYMKLSAYSEEDKAQCERGYPMSQFVRNLPAHPLTYEAREMACHFADAYAQRLLDDSPHLKIHSYRAALQYVVTRTRPDFVHGTTRLVVKKGAEIPFPQYANQCLQRLGIDASEVADDVMVTAESMTSNWRRVVAFYTLRLSLAPLVETALLLDRMLFLYEKGIPSVAVPVFDSALSPRNFALLACKAPSFL